MDITRRQKSTGSMDRAAPVVVQSPIPRIDSEQLLERGSQLIIVHGDREYRLRKTSRGKLILTA